MAFLRFIVCFAAFAIAVNESTHVIQKRGFVELGCMGNFDRSKYARLDTVCEECYEFFREPDLHHLCSDNCFKNQNFPKCVIALHYESELEELEKYVEELFRGRK